MQIHVCHLWQPQAPQVNMDELETQLEATMDAMMEARQDEPTDDSKRQALKDRRFETPSISNGLCFPWFPIFDFQY